MLRRRLGVASVLLLILYVGMGVGGARVGWG